MQLLISNLTFDAAKKVIVQWPRATQYYYEYLSQVTHTFWKAEEKTNRSSGVLGENSAETSINKIYSDIAWYDEWQTQQVKGDDSGENSLICLICNVLKKASLTCNVLKKTS